MNETLSPFVQGENLVVRYEQLRKDALSRSRDGGSGFGLALFLRQGMTAWMQVCTCAATSPAREAIQSWNTVYSLSYDVRSQAAVILAGILLSYPTEMVLCKATCTK